MTMKFWSDIPAGSPADQVRARRPSSRNEAEPIIPVTELDTIYRQGEGSSIIRLAQR